jgi:hypothetical protein
MPKSPNAPILKANRYKIILMLMNRKNMKEIAKERGVSYYALYNYLATGEILYDE